MPKTSCRPLPEPGAAVDSNVILLVLVLTLKEQVARENMFPDDAR